MKEIAQFFNVVFGVLFKTAAMPNPRTLSIFGYILKPEAVEGAFQNKFIYDYRNIKEKEAVPSRNLGQSIVGIT